MSSAGLPLRLRIMENRRDECNQMKNTFIDVRHGINPKSREYVYFGIFDGHDDPEAAQYAKDHLFNAVTSRKKFWSDNDDEVMNTIRKGYVQIHYEMWKIHETWPRRTDQFYSTSGTTASTVCIRNGKIYTAHVGDSRIVLGYQNEGEKKWNARTLTTDHKPDTPSEMSRIMKCGGILYSSSGSTSRVVWRRPSLKHSGPGLKSNLVDEIPFSAVSRFLGDLWSYNSETKEYVISPEPDVSVHPFNVETFRCLIIGTNDLWDVMDQNEAVGLVECAEKNNAKHVRHYGSPDFNKIHVERDEKGINPSTTLVMKAEDMWRRLGRKEIGARVITVLLDPAYAYSNKTREVLSPNTDSRLHSSRSEKKKISSAPVCKRRSGECDEYRAFKHQPDDNDSASPRKKSRR